MVTVLQPTYISRKLMAENLPGIYLVINEHSQFCNLKAGHVRLHYVMLVVEFSKRI